MNQFVRSRPSSCWELCCLLVFVFFSHQTFGQPQVVDIWGRDLLGQHITLVDWEGHIANPALRFQVKPPPEARFPVTVDLRADNARLYFNLPSEVSANGPSKRLLFTQTNQAISFLISIFPDRDTLSEEHHLTLTIRDANSVMHEWIIPIRILDQDQDRPTEFNLIVNRSQDATGFFAEAEKFRIAHQAAADWAYFIADMALDRVPRQTETSFIWARNGNNTGQWIKNSHDYQGFLLYIYGVEGPSLISGGQGSWDGGIQTRNGLPVGLRRSGTYQAHVAGNYNRLGWFLTQSDDDWLWTNNYGDRPNDLYSIAHHEIGHALFFDGSHPLFAQAKEHGKIDDARVVAYHGTPIVMDGVNHFPNHIDRISRLGVFGNEYHGEMPPRRWLITKLDLLCAQATGYTLRPTSAFEPLRISDAAPLDAYAGLFFRGKLGATGGIPFYYWEIIGGALPTGLGLNTFTGEITGTPTTVGTFHFDIRLRDYDEQGIALTNRFAITVRPSIQPSLAFAAGGTAGESSWLLRLTGPSGQFVRVEESIDLRTWISTITPRLIPFEEPVDPKSEHRFYRALLIDSEP